MRKDLEGWEKYDELLDDTITKALAYQENRGHPQLPSLTLHMCAEAAFAWSDKRQLTLTYGDLNAGSVGLNTHQGTAHDAVLHVASRAIVADAKVKPRWLQYLEENKYRWPQTTPPDKSA